ADLKETEAKIDVLRNLVSDDKLIIQPSSSLLHVPVTKTLETKIDPVILEGLSFADEKLKEISLLANLAQEQDSEKVAVKEATKNIKQKYSTNKSVAKKKSKLTNKDATRNTHFKERLKRQKESLRLPVLPTTTIGSLPQTKEVQQTRSKWRRGDITNDTYET